MKTVYLDWASTTKPCKQALESFTQSSLSFWANPSSKHSLGTEAQKALQSLRSQIQKNIGLSGGHMVFTSCASEANAIVLGSLLYKHTKGRVIISAIEHASVYDNALALSRLGFEVIQILPDENGHIQISELQKYLNEQTQLVSIMAVNNETGAIQKIEELSKTVKEYAKKIDKTILFHCDAVQALKKIEIDFKNPCIDFYTFSAHKIQGLKGVGLLWTRKPLTVLFPGGAQEQGMRAGTENIAGIQAFLSALELSDAEKSDFFPDEYFLNTISKISGIEKLPLKRENRDLGFSPFIASIIIDAVPGEVFVRAMNDKGIFISTGSACSNKSKNKRILEAQGLIKEKAFNAVRFSFGASTTKEEIDYAIECIKSVLSEIRI